MVEQFVPPICARIRGTRERLRQEALDRGEREKAREFTQEGVAGKLHLTVKAYRAYEKDREPGFVRRQEIATALGLASDYFEVAQTEDRDAEIRGLREELASIRGELAGLRQELHRQRTQPRPATRRRAS